ncbi:MAG: hypothetical protein ABIP51_00010 [Bacteroidia bacterium]
MIDLKTPAGKIAFKNLIKSECIKQINKRITNAKAAIAQAQDNANSNDKSTAGDKYEISRAMGQLDSDMNTKQLVEAEQELAFLEKVDVSAVSDSIKIGSAFELSGILFFVAIGIGPLTIEDKKIMVVSSKSPFYENIKTMQAGQVFEFMDKMDEIKMVF